MIQSLHGCPTPGISRGRAAHLGDGYFDRFDAVTELLLEICLASFK